MGQTALERLQTPALAGWDKTNPDVFEPAPVPVRQQLWLKPPSASRLRWNAAVCEGGLLFQIFSSLWKRGNER